MKKIEIVGLGKLLQVVHLPNLKKFFSIISCCDPRKELLARFAKKFCVNYYTSNINILLKYKKTPNLFICSSREASYEILKKVIKAKKKIFCEKPGIFNLLDAKKIQKQMNDNKKLKFGYMSRYDSSILFLKKYLKKNKKKLEIKKAIFSLNNNSFYNPNKKLDYIRTNEKDDFKFSKINYPKFLKKKDQIMYHVFLNRYSHVINMVNFIFDKITPLSVNTKDIYNYNLVGKWKNSEILINCGNKKKYIFNVHIFFSDQSEIICSLKNPTELYASKITFIKKNTKKIKLFRKENVFYQEVKNILNKNDISATYINDVIKDLDLVRSFWLLIN